MSAVLRSAGLAAQVMDVLNSDEGDVAVAPPGTGDGFWAGGPSAVWLDGVCWLAYRLRRPVDQGRGYANVVARSDDGVRFETVWTVTSEQFGAASLERPALVPLAAGGFRLYVSCSTWNSKHWWVEAIDLPDGARHMVLPGDAATAWKDIVVERVPAASGSSDGWHMWACRHPLDGGDDEADRMSTWYTTSSDGLTWDVEALALSGTAGSWDARGARVSSAVRTPDGWLAFYDGRASAAENWHERTGVAFGAGPSAFAPIDGPTASGRTARYLSVVEMPEGYRLYWEASRADGAHDLRTAYVPRPVSPSQS